MTLDFDITSASDAEKWLTPSESDQKKLKLAGLCQHNRGWKFDCFTHNSKIYSCVLCNKFKKY